MNLPPPLSLHWSEHNHAFSKLVKSLYNDNTFADCSLMSSDGKELPAHKIILSAASPLLHSMLRKNTERTPVVMLPTVEFNELSALVAYIYKGTVNIEFNKLKSFLDIARSLRVEGLEDLEELQDPLLTPTNNISDETASEKVNKTWLKVDSETTETPMNLSVENDQQEQEVEFLFSDMLEDEEEPQVIEYISDENTEDTDLKLNANDSVSEYRVLKVKNFSLPTRVQRKSTGQQDKKPKNIMNVKCKDCNGLYKNDVTYNNHLKHDCRQVHSCPECSKTFKNKRHLLDHVRDDCGRMHVCPCCSRIFKQKVNLTTHMKSYCKIASQ